MCRAFHSKEARMRTVVSNRRWNRKASAGFTLIELVIAMVIIGFLLALAIPAYNEQSRKSRRAGVKANIMSIVQAKERFNTVNGTYVGSPCTDADNYYTVTCPVATATTFTVQAVPSGSQAADRCGTLGINQAGLKTVTTATVAECW
jgi:type IV pilus assembly protein PilE